MISYFENVAHAHICDERALASSVEVADVRIHEGGPWSQPYIGGLKRRRIVPTVHSLLYVDNHIVCPYILFYEKTTKKCV